MRDYLPVISNSAKQRKYIHISACPKYSEHFPKRGPVFQTIFRHNGEIQGKFFKNPNFQGKLELQKMFAIVRGKWDTPIFLCLYVKYRQSFIYEAQSVE